MPPQVFIDPKQQPPIPYLPTDAPPMGDAAPPMLSHIGMSSPSAVFANPERTDVVAAPPPLQSQIGATSSRLQALQAKDANPYGSANNHPGVGGKILHALSVAGNIAGDIFAPATMAMIPGTDMNRRSQEGSLSQRLQGLQASQDESASKQAQARDMASQGDLRDAQGRLADTKASDFTPTALSDEQASAINHPELSGIMMTGRDYAKLVQGAGNNNTSLENNQGTNAAHVATNAATNATRTANNDASINSRENIASAADKTRALIAGNHDATSRSNNANSNDHKGGAGGGAGSAAGGNFKVPADVTKRAALAANTNENSDAVGEILQRRPDIVGAMGGRFSNVQQMIGSDDPDIKALGARVHNIALASNGAHGVRSQEAVQKTEDEIFSHFKAGPNGIRGSLGAIRGSVQTFLDDESNFQSSGRRTGAAHPATAPSGGASSQGGDAMITVQIPGQAPGQIHASNRAAFMVKYPNAQVK